MGRRSVSRKGRDPTVSDTIAVVRPYYRTEDAYKMGYNRFDGVETGLPDDAEPDLSGFRSSAAYANNTLPTLRAMAGFADSKGGTYTVERQVAAIKDGHEEDTPAEADLLSSRHVLDRLMEAWESGAYDAMEGREADIDRWDL